MTTKKIIPLVIGLHALTVMSGSNPRTEHLAFKTKESKIRTFGGRQQHFFNPQSDLNKKFVTGINYRSDNHFSILAWDLKVKFRLNRNISIAFSYQ